jgi:hypothetical protein
MLTTIHFPKHVLDSCRAEVLNGLFYTKHTNISETFLKDMIDFHNYIKSATGDDFCPRQLGCLYEEVDELIKAVKSYKTDPCMHGFAKILKEAADVSFCGLNLGLYGLNPDKLPDVGVPFIFALYPAEIEPVSKDKKLFYPQAVKDLYMDVLALVAKDNLKKIKNAEIVNGKVKGVGHDKEAIYALIKPLVIKKFNEIKELVIWSKV